MPASGNVDERIVEMRIDHDKFEQGAKKTIDILEKLDEGLKSLGKKQTDGFDDVASSLDKVTNKISVFGTIGDQIIRNLTTQAMDLVRQFNHMVDSLTIDQVSAGWSKYAQKTQGVQTIMAATAKDWEDQGAQMEYVNAQLEKLNWFTDETSYNLLDMVNNIGKFTSAGVDLETAVTAMQGIATWAGISGANTQEASRAMYNLSQALGVGAVTQIDWKSIENANMATYEFKQIVLETAAAMGKLEKVKDGVFKTDYTNKSGEIHEVTVESFRQYLSDKWFDSDVLMAALEQYGGFTDLLYEVSDATKLTATQILQQIKLYEEDKKVISKLEPYIKDLASAEYELGRRAFRAAQEAKTFQEAIDATKDAVSTAWMNVFETIFGDYLKAKELWTSVAESLYTIFADPVNRLWEIFDQAFNGPNPLRDSLAEAGYTMGELEEAAKSTIEELSSSKDYNDVFRADALQKLIDKYGSLEGAIKAGAVSASMFSMILDQMNRNTIDDILLGKNTHFNDVLTDLRQNAMWFMNGAIDEQTLIARGYNMDMIKYWVAAYEKAKKSGKEDDDITPYTDEFMEKFYDDLLKLAGYTDEEIEAFKELGLTVNQVLESMTDPMVTRTEGFKLFADSLLNLLTVVENIGNAISSAFSVIFGGGTGEGADEIANSNAAEGLYQLIERFHNFTESLVLTEDEMNTLRDRFVSFFESISSVRGIFDIIGAVLSGIWNIVLKIFGAISDSKLLPTLLNAALILLQALAIPLGLIVSGISALINKGQELSKQEWAQRLTGWFTQLGTKILDAANRFKTFMESSEVAAWLTSTLDKIVSFLSPLADGFSNAIKKIQYFWKVLKQVFKLSGFSGVLKWLGANISAKLSLIFDDLKKKFSKENIKATFNSIITSISNFFTSNTSLGAIGTAIKTFFSNIFEKIYTFISSKIDMSKLSPAWESIKNFFIGIFNSVSSFLTGKFNFKGFGDAFTSIWEFIKNIASKVKNFVSSKFSFENIGDTLKSFIRVLSDLVREAMPLIRTGLVIYVLTSIIQWSRSLRWLVEAPSEFAEGFKIAAIAGMIASISLLIIALAGAVKLLSTLSPDELKTGLIGLASIGAILLGFISLLVLIETRLDAFGSVATSVAAKAGKAGASFKKTFSISGLWSIIPIIIAIGALVAAVMVLGKMDFGQLVQGIVSLTILLTELLGFIVFSSLFIRLAGPGINSILGIAAGIWLMASAMKKLGDLNIKQILKGWFGIHLIISELQRFAITSLLMDPWGMQGLIYAAGAVWIIAQSLRGLATMKIEAMLKGIIGLHLIVGELIRFTRRGRQIQNGKQLWGLIGVALTVLILVGALKGLATMSFGEIIKAWIALFLLIGQLVRVMQKSMVKSFIPGGTAIDTSSFWSLIFIALAVAGLAAVMVALGKIPAKQLLKGFLAITAVMNGLSILMRSSKGIFKAKAVRSIAAALGIIGIIVASAYVLKKLSDIPGKRLAAAAGSLSLVLVAIAGAMTLVSRFSGGFGNVIPGVLLMLGGVAALFLVAEILAPLGESDLDWKRIGEVALVLVGTILGVSAAILLISKVPAGAAISGIGKVGLIFAAIEAVILVLIGIGILVVEAATTLAGKLAIFVEKLQPFLDSIKSWDASTVENVTRFAEVMGLLMLAEVFTAVASALAKVPSAALFADLSTLGKKVKEFANDISTLTDDDITRIGTFSNVMAAIAGITGFEALASFFAMLSEAFFSSESGSSSDSGAVASAKAGLKAGLGIEENIEKVSSLFEHLNELATGLTDSKDGFIAKLGAITPDDVAKVQNFADIMKAFAGVEGWAFVAEMLNTLGNITAKVGNKVGIGDNFVTNIVALYEAVRKVVDGLGGNGEDEKPIDDKAITKIQNFTKIIQEITAITGWTAIGKMLTSIGNKTGISVVTLQTNLKNLVIVARSFSDTIKDQNIGGGTTKKIKNFADIMNAIGKITAWHNISRMMTYLGNKFGNDYAVELNALPQTIASFATAIQEANIPTDGGVVDQVKAFADIMKEIARITGWATFADIVANLSPASNTSGDAKNAMEMLRDFTAALPDFLTNISGLDGSEPEKIRKFTDCISEIISAKIWTTSWAVATTDEAEKATELIDVLDVFNEHFVPFFQRFNSDLSMVDVLNVQRAFEILDNIGKNNILNNLVNQLQSFWMDLTLIDFSENGGIDLKTMAELLNGTASVISEILSLHELLKTTNDPSASISGALGSVLDALRIDGTIEEKADFVGQSISGWIANGVTNNLMPFFDAGTLIAGKIEDGIKDYYHITEEAGSDTAESAAAGVESATGDLEDAGSDLGAGAVEGIRSQMQAAYDAGADIGASAEDGLRNQTLTQSPSRVFMKLGGYLVQGLVQGMNGNSGDAEESMAGIGDDLITTVTNIIDKIIEVGDNAQPMIALGNDLIAASSETIDKVVSANGDNLTAGVLSLGDTAVNSLSPSLLRTVRILAPIFATALTAASAVLVDMMPELSQHFVNGLITLLSDAGTSMMARKDEIAESFKNIISAITAIIPVLAPVIVDCLITLADSLYTTFQDRKEEITSSITNVVTMVVEIIRDVIKEVFGGESYEDMDFGGKLILGLFAAKVQGSFLNDFITPFEKLHNVLGGGGTGLSLPTLLSSVSGTIEALPGIASGAASTIATLASSFGAIVAPLLIVAGAFAWASKLVDQQYASAREEAFDGAAQDLDGYAQAIEHVQARIAELDELEKSGWGTYMSSEELTTQRGLLAQLLQEYEDLKRAEEGSTGVHTGTFGVPEEEVEIKPVVPDGSGFDVEKFLADAGYTNIQPAIIKEIEGVTDAVSAELPNVASEAEPNGQAIGDGVAKGIYNSEPIVSTAVSWLANLCNYTFTSTEEIKSPSRVFARLGAFLPAGLAEGIKENSSIAEDSMTILGSAVLAAMQMAMAQVATVADEDFDISPRITPVVDMSNVEFAAGATGRAFGSVGTAVRGSMRLAMDTLQASNNPRDNGSGNIVNEIRTMSAKLDGLESAVSSMQIVLDTGTLVGSTSKKMDAALGVQQARKSRAN